MISGLIADPGLAAAHKTQALQYLSGPLQSALRRGIFVLEPSRYASSEINCDRTRRGSYLLREAQIHHRDVYCSSEGSQIESVYAGVFSEISCCMRFIVTQGQGELLISWYDCVWGRSPGLITNCTSKE